MSSTCCCSEGLQTFSDWVIPEAYIQRHHLGDFYRNNPLMSRLIATPIALFSGIIKTFLFPVICLVGVVVMPIIALIKAGKKEGSDWLKGWFFSILGASVSCALLAVSCFYLPLIVTAALLATFLSISVVIHVYKLVKEPSPIKY